MKKKGQLSIFIIAGVVIVILAFILLYYYQPGFFLGEPEEAAGVQAQVEACIRDALGEAVELAARQGGYVYIPDDIILDQRRYVYKDLTGFAHYPKWRVEGRKDIPDLEIIRKQMNTYVADAAQTCMLSEYQGYQITPLEDPVAEVSLNDQSVSAVLRWPIRVQVRNQTTTFRDYSSEVRYRFKHLYEKSQTLLQYEEDTSFLEYTAIDLITISPEETVPYTGYEIFCGRKQWSKAQIDDHLKRLYEFNFPYLRIEGANAQDSIVDISSEKHYADSYFANHFVIDTQQDFSDLRVSFFYDPQFPFESYVSPSKNGILSSNRLSGSDVLSFFCINIWHFSYNVKFPLVVKVQDQDPDFEPLTFSFATDVLVRNNQPHKESFTVNVEEHTYDPTFDERYCRTSATDPSLYLLVVDDLSGAPVENASITMNCGPSYCPLGMTDEQGAFIGNVPYCSFAQLTINKSGYAQKRTVTELERAANIKVGLPVIKQFEDIEIYKHTIVDKENIGPAQPLGAREYAVISITSADINSVGGSYISNLAEQEQQPLTLVASDSANYTVMITILDKDTNALLGMTSANIQPDFRNLQSTNTLAIHSLYIGEQSEQTQGLFFMGLEGYSRALEEQYTIIQPYRKG